MPEAHALTRTIIESPCSGDMERNADYLADCLLDSLKRGEAPIASHGLLAFSGVLDDTTPEERETGIAAGIAWYAGAQSCAVYQDHGISFGMQRGIDEAERLGIPIHYRTILDAVGEVEQARLL